MDVIESLAGPEVGARTGSPRLRIHDLGALSIDVDGESVMLRSGMLSRVLATLLINANRRVAIETLIEAVWADDGRASRLGTLESHIWRLRKLMEPGRGRREEPVYVVSDNLGYRLVVDPDNADSLRFVQLAEHGDRLIASGDAARALERYELALSLWRGRPFDPIADDEFAAAAVGRLSEICDQVQEQRIEALLRTGQPEQAVRDLEDLIGRLPFRERLWAQLMIARYQVGRVEEALATYGQA